MPTLCPPRSRRPLVAALLVLCAAPALALQEKVLTPHDVARLRNVVSAAISPDGRQVAYRLAVPRDPFSEDDGGAWTELHVAEVDGGRSRPFVSGKVNVGSFEWTPDGTGIAFLAKREGDEHSALYVIPIDGGEGRRAAKLEKTSISSFDLSPDGSKVALVASEPVPEERKKAEKKGFKQEVYEEDWRFARVWIATPFDEESKPVELELEGSVHQVRWSPKGDLLAVAIAPTPGVDDSYMRQRVRVVDAASGEVRAKIENPGKLGSIAWSPDGSRIAMVAAADIHDPIAGRLMLAPAEGGAPVELLPGYPGKFEAVAWQDEGSLMYVASQGVWTVFEKIDATPGAEPKRLFGPEGPILGDLSLSADGLRAAFVADAPEHPGEVFTMAHGEDAPRRVTDSNPWLPDFRLAPQEVVRFQARDGLELEGILIRPLEARAGQRYPLVLYVHGGPEAHHSNGWLTSYGAPGQVAAARGMAVFYTNYRGSTGRGVEFAKLSQGDPAGKEFDDLVDAVDHLIAAGLADGDKVGVTGGSYGGYATGWLSTRYSERFAAGVMFVGISDKISKVGTTDIPDEEFYVHARHRPWEDWQFFLERSPIFHAEKGRTPLLILHGKDDPRVDPGQSRELYRHLKLRGQAPVRLVHYPGEGHGNRKAAARLDYNLRMLRWLEHYLTGPGGEPPPIELEHADPSKEKEAEPAPEGASAG